MHFWVEDANKRDGWCLFQSGYKYNNSRHSCLPDAWPCGTLIERVDVCYGGVLGFGLLTPGFNFHFQGWIIINTILFFQKLHVAFMDAHFKLNKPFALSGRQQLRPPKRAWRPRTRRIAARWKICEASGWTTIVPFDCIREAGIFSSALNWLSSAIRNEEGRVSSDLWNNYPPLRRVYLTRIFSPKSSGVLCWHIGY